MDEESYSNRRVLCSDGNECDCSGAAEDALDDLVVVVEEDPVTLGTAVAGAVAIAVEPGRHDEGCILGGGGADGYGSGH
jgi:hypothetical protein